MYERSSWLAAGGRASLPWLGVMTKMMSLASTGKVWGAKDNGYTRRRWENLPIIPLEAMTSAPGGVSQQDCSQSGRGRRRDAPPRGSELGEEAAVLEESHRHQEAGEPNHDPAAMAPSAQVPRRTQHWTKHRYRADQDEGNNGKCLKGTRPRAVDGTGGQGGRDQHTQGDQGTAWGEEAEEPSHFDGPSDGMPATPQGAEGGPRVHHDTPKDPKCTGRCPGADEVGVLGGDIAGLVEAGSVDNEYPHQRSDGDRRRRDRASLLPDSGA